MGHAIELGLVLVLLGGEKLKRLGLYVEYVPEDHRHLTAPGTQFGARTSSEFEAVIVRLRPSERRP